MNSAAAVFSRHKNNKGFTLVELTAAIFIFSLVALFAANMIIHTIKVNERLRKRSELREQAWVALEFLAAHIKLANGYKITYYSQGSNSLLRLDLFINASAGAAEHNYVFTFARNSRRLNFGGLTSGLPGVNELSKNISDVKINIDESKKLMYITVIAEDGEESLTLDTSVSLRYIELRK